MEISCFKCGHCYDTNRPNPQYDMPSRCEQCGWNGGAALSEEEDRYLVLLSLIYRAGQDGQKIDPYLYRIPASSREMAVLRHGDQCSIDGVNWRITARNVDKNVFFLRGTRNLKDSTGYVIEFAPDEPAEQLVEEANRWNSRWHGLHFLREMTAADLDRYLSKPEKEKKKIRKAESP